ncbi:cell division protein FtsL [Ectothiorhodospiraceae bacterium 2226]|nr:cell division protein FtsL [Ectothiorhodospiraceae bacterium 2226]
MRAYLVPLILLLAVLASAVGVVVSKHESRKLFVELQGLQGQRDAMQIEWGQLQLEQSTWATHGRVERLAAGELGMALPPTDDVVILAHD